MSTLDSNKMKTKAKNRLEFEKALELRNFEITNFWSRGWFFGALLLAIFTGYGEVKIEHPSIVPPICISFIAFLISCCQSLMNRGSKYWQERWEYVTKNRESALGIDLTKTKKFNGKERAYIDASILAKDENNLTVSRRFSVTKLTFLVWDIITICCLLFWINDVYNFCTSISDSLITTGKIISFHCILLIYILFFFFGGKGNKYGKVFEHFKPYPESMKDETQNNNDHYRNSEKYVTDSMNNT